MSSTLQEGLKRAARRETAAAPARKRAATKDTKKPESSRAGTVLIGGHFDVSVRQRLLMIRVAHPELTMQALLEQALDLLFTHYKQPRIG
jgi:hypothetical protein